MMKSRLLTVFQVLFYLFMCGCVGFKTMLFYSLIACALIGTIKYIMCGRFL